MSTQRSSFYNSYLGETKTKFQFSNFRGSKNINEPEFFKWTSNNMYRTSYNDMAKKVSYHFSNVINLHRANPLKEKTV